MVYQTCTCELLSRVLVFKLDHTLESLVVSSQEILIHLYHGHNRPRYVDQLFKRFQGIVKAENHCFFFLIF